MEFTPPLWHILRMNSGYVMKLPASGLTICAALASLGSPAIAQNGESDASRAEQMEAFVINSLHRQVALWLNETDLWIADYRRAEQLLERSLLRNGAANTLLVHRTAIVKLQCSTQANIEVDLADIELLRTKHQRFRQAHQNLLTAVSKIAEKPTGDRRPEIAIDEPF